MYCHPFGVAATATATGSAALDVTRPPAVSDTPTDIESVAGGMEKFPITNPTASAAVPGWV